MLNSRDPVKRRNTGSQSVPETIGVKTKRARGRPTASVAIDEELFLQPWFIPKPTYLAIRRLLPSCQLAKMRLYFDDYGCLKCESRKAIYGSNGLCQRCSIIVRSRVVLSLNRRFKKIGVEVEKRPVHRYLSRIKNRSG
jgi:hypothetical protein